MLRPCRRHACTRSTSAPGETLRVDTGCLVALQPSVNYDIQFVGGVKTALFGGEGLFFATLPGPGQVWLQSLPLSRLADRIYTAAPQTGLAQGRGIDPRQGWRTGKPAGRRRITQCCGAAVPQCGSPQVQQSNSAEVVGRVVGGRAAGEGRSVGPIFRSANRQ